MDSSTNETTPTKTGWRMRGFGLGPRSSRQQTLPG